MTDRQSTHSCDCWDWGPKHYERAVREIKALRAEVANWKRVATIRTKLHDESESRAERAEAALAELRAERDALAAALEAAREDAEARVAELEAVNERLRKSRNEFYHAAEGRRLANSDLRRRNAELQARVAELEQQLTAMQGGEA